MMMSVPLFPRPSSANGDPCYSSSSLVVCYSVWVWDFSPPRDEAQSQSNAQKAQKHLYLSILQGAVSVLVFISKGKTRVLENFPLSAQSSTMHIQINIQLFSLIFSSPKVDLFIFKGRSLALVRVPNHLLPWCPLTIRTDGTYPKNLTTLLTDWCYRIFSSSPFICYSIWHF